MGGLGALLVCSGLTEAEAEAHARAARRTVPGIVVLREPRPGLSHARNRALAAMRGRRRARVRRRRRPARPVVAGAPVGGVEPRRTSASRASAARSGRASRRRARAGSTTRCCRHSAWSTTGPGAGPRPVRAHGLRRERELPLRSAAARRRVRPGVWSPRRADLVLRGGRGPARARSRGLDDPLRPRRVGVARRAARAARPRGVPAAALQLRRDARGAQGALPAARRAAGRDSAVGAPVAAVRGDERLFMERALRAVENAGVLAGPLLARR